jgi:hypothetical protein
LSNFVGLGTSGPEAMLDRITREMVGDTERTGGNVCVEDVVGDGVALGGELLEDGDALEELLGSGDALGELLGGGDVLGGVLEDGDALGGVLGSGDALGELLRGGVFVGVESG